VGECLFWYRCLVKYVALPNNSQYEICATSGNNLTLTLQLTVTVTKEINKHLRTRLCDVAMAWMRVIWHCELFDTTPTHQGSPGQRAVKWQCMCVCDTVGCQQEGYLGDKPN